MLSAARVFRGVRNLMASSNGLSTYFEAEKKIFVFKKQVYIVRWPRHTPLITALGKQRQLDLGEFKASLSLHTKFQDSQSYPEKQNKTNKKQVHMPSSFQALYKHVQIYNLYTFLYSLLWSTGFMQ